MLFSASERLLSDDFLAKNGDPRSAGAGAGHRLEAGEQVGGVAADHVVEDATEQTGLLLDHLQQFDALGLRQAVEAPEQHGGRALDDADGAEQPVGDDCDGRLVGLHVERGAQPLAMAAVGEEPAQGGGVPTAQVLLGGAQLSEAGQLVGRPRRVLAGGVEIDELVHDGRVRPRSQQDLVARGQTHSRRIGAFQSWLEPHLGEFASHYSAPMPGARTRTVALALAAVAALAACAGRGASDGTKASGDTRQDAPTSSPSACQPEAVEERAAAVLVVGFPGVTESSDPVVTQVLATRVGGILLTEPNVRSSAQIGQLVSDIKARAGRPLVVATGEESGRVSTFRDLFGRTPSARALAARPAPAVQQLASEIGSKLAAIGVNLDLAPVVDLDAGPAGGLIGDRSFSADPVRAATYGLAWARGLTAAGVAPTAKHFPGHGRATQDSHLELPRVDTSLDELRGTDLRPFAELIKAGVPAVMLDHVAYAALDPELPASLAPKAYALLREMGFNGVAITDSVGMGAVNLRWGFGEAAVRAITAGADAVLTTDGTQAPAMRDALVAAVRSGALPEARLNEAAGRVVALAGGDAKGLTCTSPRLPELG